jgi:HTH-type transcriptional regulator/antitoxin HigA
MEILPIRTNADYRRTLKEIETLMDAAPKSQKGERLDVLATLVETYERNLWKEADSTSAGEGLTIGD